MTHGTVGRFGRNQYAHCATSTEPPAITTAFVIDGIPTPPEPGTGAASATLDEPGAAARFATEGFAVFRGLFGRDEVAHWRQLLRRIMDDPQEPAAFRRAGGAFVHVDGVTQRAALWPLIFDERLLAAMRTVLGRDIRYVRHSDLHVNHPLQPCWHRDINETAARIDARVARTGVPFAVARAAIYLHDGMRLGLVPGSHRPGRRWRGDFGMGCANVLNRALARVLRPAVAPPGPGSTAWIALEPGDCLLFDVRLIHSGGYAASGPDGAKLGLFLAYGAPNGHSARHGARYLGYHALAGTPLPPGLERRLAEAGLLLDERLPQGFA